MSHRPFLLAACAATTFALTAPAAATVLLPGATGQPTQALPAGTAGTVLASQSVTGTAATFSATFNQAVYRNTLGTLDFYYQVARTGAGSEISEEIRSFTVSSFAGYTVDAFVNGADTDGSGPFLAVNNPAARGRHAERIDDDLRPCARRQRPHHRIRRQRPDRDREQHHLHLPHQRADVQQPRLFRRDRWFDPLGAHVHADRRPLGRARARDLGDDAGRIRRNGCRNAPPPRGQARPRLKNRHTVESPRSARR